MKRLFITLAGCSLLAAACNNPSTTSSASGADSASMAASMKQSMKEKNEATALSSVQAFNTGNLDVAFKDVTADGVDYGDGSMPPVKGLDSIKPYAKMFLDAFPDYKGSDFMTFSDSNHVAVYAVWTGTFKNALMGMKPTGKSFKVPDVDIFTFNADGKITEHRSVQSLGTILKQVGAQMKH